MKVTISFEHEEHNEGRESIVVIQRPDVVSMADLAQLFSDAATAGTWNCDGCTLYSKPSEFSSEY